MRIFLNNFARGFEGRISRLNLPGENRRCDFPHKLASKVWASKKRAGGAKFTWTPSEARNFPDQRKRTIVARVSPPAYREVRIPRCA